LRRIKNKKLKGMGGEKPHYRVGMGPRRVVGRATRERKKGRKVLPTPPPIVKAEKRTKREKGRERPRKTSSQIRRGCLYQFGAKRMGGPEKRGGGGWKEARQKTGEKYDKDPTATGVPEGCGMGQPFSFHETGDHAVNKTTDVALKRICQMSVSWQRPYP